MAELLLDHGADIIAVAEHGLSALHFAVRSGDVDMIQFLLGQGIDVEGGDEMDCTALHHAAMDCEPDLCEFLLKRGAMVNIKSKAGNTPLKVALFQFPETWLMMRRLRTVRVLLKYGARVSDKLRSPSLLEIVATEREDIRNVLTQHVARETFLDLEISEQDLQTIEKQDCYKRYYQRCLQEIEIMKETKFYNNLPITILLKNKKAISRYARNAEFVRALDNKDYDTKFPIYFSSLKMRIDTAVKESRLRDSVAEILRHIFNFNDLMHPINQKILSFLSDAHWKYLKN